MENEKLSFVPLEEAYPGEISLSIEPSASIESYPKNNIKERGNFPLESFLCMYVCSFFLLYWEMFARIKNERHWVEYANIPEQPKG